MPRTKESDDESEIKTARRSRAITGTNVVDSPLRRSTRNRQQVNREISPDGVSSGPVTRTTRRKAASQEVFTSEPVRTLRSRKMSFTSDTSENHDQETADIKRITRKSTTNVTSDTPTSIRLRRSVRAGSESKTIQSPTKTNRLTRASSLDLEERDIESNLQVPHNSTPIKIRRRASIIPSEPVLIEEIEKDHNSFQESLQSIIEHDPKEKEVNDIEEESNTSDDFFKGADFDKSPTLRLSRGFTPDVEVDSNQSNENVNDGSTSLLKSSSVGSLKLVSEEINDSGSKEELTILNNSKDHVNEIIQTPKVVIEKMKFPLDMNSSKSLDISPNNKENKKSNVTIPTKKFQFFNSDEAPTQRKSLITIASEKISPVKRLNKSIDDKMLITNENLSNKSLSISKKLLEISSDSNVIDENVFSVGVDTKNEPIVSSEKIHKSDDDVDSSNNTTIPHEQSLKSTSLNVSIKDNLKTYKNNEVEKSCQDNEILIMDIDETEFNSSTEELQNIDGPSKVTSPSSESKKVSDGDESSPVKINEARSIVDESETNNIEQEIIMENNFEDELPVNNVTSYSKSVKENDKESNKSVSDEPDYDLNQLFKDIPAEEWNEESPIQSNENNTSEKKDLEIQTKKIEDTINDEEESTEDFELVLVDKKAWEAAETERLKKMKEVYSFGSEDSIQTDGSFRNSIEPPASPSFEEPMEIDDNEVGDEVEKSPEEDENKPLNSSQDQLNTNQQVLNESNDKIEKVHEYKDTLTPNKSDNLEKQVKHKQITPMTIGPVTSSKTLIAKDNNLSRQSLDSLLSSNKTLKTSPLKTRKSLNPSIKLDIITQDIEKENKIKTPIKSSNNSTDKSLNDSKLKNTDEMSTTENKELKKEPTTKSPKAINKSLNQSVSEQTEENTSHKEAIVKNHISPVKIDSDTQSTDSENESDDPDITLPAFLLDGSSDSSNQLENDPSSTDSDIAREYNLNGDDVLEYSDDDVSGDICHASETESSESDEEDDDLASFIVDDDEEIEEEEEEEEENESDSENNTENETSDKENDSNEEIQDDDEEEKYITSKRSTPNKHSILQENNLCGSKYQVLQSIKPKVDKLNTSDLVKSTKKDKSTLLKKSKTKLENSFTVEDVPIASKLSKTSSFNKSVLPSCPTNPETRLLLKEKLNDSLPALKLEQSNRTPKNSLNFVVENYEEDTGDDKPIGINVSKKSINKISESKIQIKKKKPKTMTKIVQHGFNVEDVSPPIKESLKLSKISDKIVEKKKKKALQKNSSLNPDASSGKKKGKVEKKQKLTEKKENKKKLIPIKEISQTSTQKITKKKVNKKNNDVSENSLPKVTNIKPEKSSSVESILRTQSRVKRLPDDVIEGLFNIPVPPKKKRKLNQKVLPSRTMFDLEHPKPDHINIEEGEFIPLNSSGSTTSFYVTNLEKPKKSKKLAAVYAFRDRVLRRNPRQPISAYLMYQQKIQASRKDKF